MAVSASVLACGMIAAIGFGLIFVGTPADRSVALDAQLAADKPAIPAYTVALKRQIAAYSEAVGPRAASAVAEAGGIRLRSVGFEFPTSDRAFPGGAGAELVANNCVSCHSAGMILNQPALTKAEWTGEVTKMLRTYKAPVAEQDMAGIVAYLAGLKVGS